MDERLGLASGLSPRETAAEGAAGFEELVGIGNTVDSPHSPRPTLRSMPGRGKHRGTPLRSGWPILLILAVVLGAIGFRLASDSTSRPSRQAGQPTGPRSLQPTGALSPTALSPSPSASNRPRLQRPPIVWKPIPYTSERKAEMAAYARSHYGIDSWRLRDPHVIVEHYTASDSFLSTWSEFARDVPDPEFHSLPADCAHFVIDTDGTIYQLVPLGVMCRHTVGLNWTAIGIEMVATSDRQVLNDPAQLRSAMHLTAWLMSRFHIQIGNVIGHNESLDSPFHRELLASWRCQTHQDWKHADMQTFRADLARYLRSHGVPLGRPWKASLQTGC